MYQKTFIIGNLGIDPQVRYTPSGQPVTRFTVASNRKWNDSQGDTHKETVWFNVSSWGAQGQACAQYLKKGSLVFIEGRQNASENGTPRVWTRQDGTVSASYDITAQHVTFLSRSENGNNDEIIELPVEVGMEVDIPF